MDHRARFSTLSARYDDFLFAPVCEEANGTRLSVLSALARMNVDPWEEASRLAALPKIIAEKSLLSALARASGRSWKAPEAATIAARLVRLLPEAPVAANAAAGAANGPRRQTAYWWVLLALSLALSFMLLRQQEETTIGEAVSGLKITDTGPSTAGSEPQSHLNASSAERRTANRRRQ